MWWLSDSVWSIVNCKALLYIRLYVMLCFVVDFKFCTSLYDAAAWYWLQVLVQWYWYWYWYWYLRLKYWYLYWYLNDWVLATTLRRGSRRIRTPADEMMWYIVSYTASTEHELNFLCNTNCTRTFLMSGSEVNERDWEDKDASYTKKINTLSCQIKLFSERVTIIFILPKMIANTQQTTKYSKKKGENETYINLN